MVFRKAAGWGSLRNGVWLPHETSTLATISIGGGPVVPPPSGGPTNLILPLITGVNGQSETLTVSDGTWDEAVSITRVWKLDGVATGATGPTTTSAADSAGKVYTCEITATGANGSTTVTTLSFGIQTSVTVIPDAVGSTFLYATASPGWSNTGNVLINDATAATATVTLGNAPSAYLPIQFANASIPTDARIDGVRVTLNASASSGMRVARLYLTDAVGNMPTGTPVLDDSVVIDTGTTTTTWGGPNEAFGLTLTPQGFNNGEVGVAVSFKVASGTRTISLKYATLEVFYTPKMGNATLPQVATATSMLRNSQTGNTAKLDRIFFPGETRVPAAIMFMTNNFSVGEFANGTVGTAKKANVLAHFIGMATPTRQAAAERILNTTNWVTAGVGNNASLHIDRAIPSDGAGWGPSSDYIIANSGSAARFNVDAWGAGYIDLLNIATPGNNDIVVHITAFFGVSAHLENREGFNNDGSVNSRTVTTGFEPEVLIGIGQDLPESAAHGAYAFWNMGFATRSGSTWSQWTTNHTIATRYYDVATLNATPFANTWQTLVLSTSSLCYNINTNDPGVVSEPAAALPYGLTYRHGVTGSSATGYTYAPNDPVPFRSQSEDAYMVLALAGLNNFKAGFATTPATTGRTVLDVGFRTHGAILFNTLGTSVARFDDDASLADTSSITMLGATNAYTQGVSNPGNDAPPMASNSYLHKGVMLRSGDFAAPVDRVVAALEQHAANGPVLNYTTADATPRQLMYLAFG